MTVEITELRRRSKHFVRIQRINGNIEINPWDQPDMRLRETLLFSTGDLGKTDGFGHLTVEQAVEITGIRNNEKLREVINDMAVFSPVYEDKRLLVGWNYNPNDLNIWTNPNFEPFKGSRR